MKKLVIFMLLSLQVLLAWSGTSFVAKNPVYKGLTSKYRGSLNVNICDIFEYPNGIPINTDFRKGNYDVNLEFDFSGSDGSLSFYKYDTNDKGQVVSLYIAGNSYGTYQCEASIEYKGETVKSVITVERYAVISKEDAVIIRPGEECVIDVLANDNFAITKDKNNPSLLSLEKVTRKPKHGTLSLTQVGERPAFLYVGNKDVPNYTNDTIAYSYDLAYEDAVELVEQISFILPPP